MRELFWLDPQWVFLNHGSFGACPREVLAAQQQWQVEMERNPVAFLGRRSASLLRAARDRLGQALGAQGADLVFVPNATTGVNMMAQTLALAPGDEVLTTDLEYGACDATWHHHCQRAGAHYRRLPVALPLSPQALIEQVAQAIGPRTRLLFLSHITSTTALILPVAQLCALARAHGVPVLIDGAHAPGQIPLDIEALGADVYVGNAHKWLCAPKGAGFVWAHPRWQAALRPSVISWGYVGETGGHTGFNAYLGQSVFEQHLQWQGTRDLSAWLAVPAALDFQARHDWPAVRARCHAMAREVLHTLCARLGTTPIGADSDWAQMVAIPVPSHDPEQLRQYLFDRCRIEIPVTSHAGAVFVRLSVQGYNTGDDVTKLVHTLCTDV